MIRYAKIKEGGTLEYAPRDIPGISNWLSTPTAVIAAGYLPVAEVETPAGQYVTGYQIEDGQIMPIFSSLPEPTYSELRRRAYPAIEEQLDMIYWDKINGTNTWAEMIAEIKAAYPKPEDKSEAENA